jgi:N-acetyl sugar amidotransferase
MTALYGLPETVAFCKTCVISNQRPASTVEYKHLPETPKQTIYFDSEGICDACRVAEAKKTIDWAERERELRDLLDQYRSKDGSYDCIVPGSGGKDSFYAAHRLKYDFGMHPLTVTWAPHMTTDWGRRNWQRWLNAGFDNYLVTPNPKTHRLLTRLAVENLFHPFQPFIIGQKAMAPKFASMVGIPLVIYGENEAEYGNPKDDAARAQRDSGYFSPEGELFLGGVSTTELQSRYGLTKADLEPYLPTRSKVDVRYLGYYLKWHPQSAYYYSVEHGGFEASPERTPGTYSKYSSIDDKVDDLHYLTTHIKFGIGRATYDAAQEIRSGDITRDEGVALVKRFDGEFPDRFATQIFDYLSVPEFPQMTLKRFKDMCDEFRSPHLWKKEGNEWALRHAVWH